MTVAASPPREPDKPEMAVIRTVCYSALFDYPLTLEELVKSLVEVEMDGPQVVSLYQSSPVLQSVIEHRDGYFFLRGQDDSPARRKRRTLRTLHILRSNRWVLKLICALPYTRMVALSGSAAHLNLEEDGDLDLFIITRGPHVWLVAVTILLLTKLLGKRKLICFNFLVSDERLTIDRTDLFSANQILSLRPLIGGELASPFLERNPFVQRFYPNLRGLERAPIDCSPGRALSAFKLLKETVLRAGFSQVGESICRRLYQSHLLSRKDSWSSPEEVVLSKDVLKLHSHGHRARVYRDYLRILDRVLRDADKPSREGSVTGNRSNGTGVLRETP